MKIAVWHNLPSGGGKRALYYHVRGLVERGHYVESWCPPTATQSFLPLGELITENVVKLDEIKANKTPLSRLTGSYSDLCQNIANIEKHCHECAIEIDRGKFDILLVHPCQVFHTSPIASFFDGPVTLYLQEPFRPFYESMPQLPWLASSKDIRPWWNRSRWASVVRNSFDIYTKRVQARAERDWAEKFDKILVNSLFSRESILRVYGLEAMVCYLGVDGDLFQAAAGSREKFVIGLGAIHLGKGIDRAIRAIATIPISKRPPFVWVGNFSQPEYEREIRSLASSLSVDFTTRVFVSDDELTYLLGKAACMLYTPRLEPFGFAPLEANLCGTPVVAIAEGGVRETIENGVNGILVNGDDSHEIGKAISEFTDNLQKADEMGIVAREHVLRKWKWDESVDKVEQTMLNLI